jgi:predicted Zn-dependent peptidase
MVQILYEKISYGLEADFLMKEQEIIKKISCEEVHRVAEEYLHPEKLVTVVVGREPIEGFVQLPGTNQAKSGEKNG